MVGKRPRERDKRIVASKMADGTGNGSAEEEQKVC